MRRTLPRFVAGCALVAALGRPAMGLADDAPASSSFTESALVTYALEHNPDLHVARSDKDIAVAETRAAAALDNPVARVEWLHVQDPTVGALGVGLSWRPPQPGVYGAGIDLAQAHVAEVSADLAERGADVEAAVRSACAFVDATTEKLALLDEAMATRRALEAAVKERLAHGASSRIDVSLVALSVAKAEQERASLGVRRASALASLASFAGLPPGTVLALDGQAVPPIGLEQSDEQELVRRALAARAVVRADAARRAAGDQALRAERARRWPWFEISGRYRKNDQSSYPSDVTLGVQVNLPVFNQNGGRIDAAVASQTKQLGTARAHALAIERDVRALRAEAVRSKALLDGYDETVVPLLHDTAGLVREALRSAAVDVATLLVAEDAATRSAIERIDARLAYRQAAISLTRAVGIYGARPTHEER